MNKKCFDNFIVNSWVPKEIVEWVEGVVWKNYLSTDEISVKEKIEHKVSHTLQVVETGWEIMEQEKIFNKKQGVIVCFLHDIGRFPQLKQNSYSDTLTGIDHGGLGAKMVGELNYDFEKEGLNKSEIVEAIMWHNKKEYKGNNIYAKLARDADKTALFLILDYMEKEEIEIGHTGNNIKEEVLEKLEKGECTDNKSVESVSEMALNVASWLSDINYSYSKVLAKKSKIEEKIIELLLKNGNNDKEVERVKNYFSNIY